MKPATIHRYRQKPRALWIVPAALILLSLVPVIAGASRLTTWFLCTVVRVRCEAAVLGDGQYRGNEEDEQCGGLTFPPGPQATCPWSSLALTQRLNACRSAFAIRAVGVSANVRGRVTSLPSGACGASPIPP
jgi:hypothetical protein